MSLAKNNTEIFIQLVKKESSKRNINSC